jgi:hypothetical protein
MMWGKPVGEANPQGGRAARRGRGERRTANGGGGEGPVNSVKIYGTAGGRMKRFSRQAGLPSNGL